MEKKSSLFFSSFHSYKMRTEKCWSYRIFFLAVSHLSFIFNLSSCIFVKCWCHFQCHLWHNANFSLWWKNAFKVFDGWEWKLQPNQILKTKFYPKRKPPPFNLISIRGFRVKPKWWAFIESIKLNVTRL